MYLNPLMLEIRFVVLQINFRDRLENHIFYILTKNGPDSFSDSFSQAIFNPLLALHIKMCPLFTIITQNI